MVGMVGGGSVAALNELTTDVSLGACISLSGVAISRMFGEGLLARCLLKVVQFFILLFSGSAFVRRQVYTLLSWMNEPCTNRFTERASAAGSPEALMEGVVNRMGSLEKLVAEPQV